MGITPSPSDVARLLAYRVITLAYIGVWLAFAILCSVVLRRAATAALAVHTVGKRCLLVCIAKAAEPDASPLAATDQDECRS